jgi:hypothetical protein
MTGQVNVLVGLLAGAGGGFEYSGTLTSGVERPGTQGYISLQAGSMNPSPAMLYGYELALIANVDTNVSFQVAIDNRTDPLAANFFEVINVDGVDYFTSAAQFIPADSDESFPLWLWFGTRPGFGDGTVHLVKVK